MAMLPTGQVSNHYESKYWDLFDVPERETSFEYDGHTPNEAADRLEQYLNQKKSGLTFEEAFKFLKDGNMIKRRGWKMNILMLLEEVVLAQFMWKSH